MQPSTGGTFIVKLYHATPSSLEPSPSTAEEGTAARGDGDGKVEVKEYLLWDRKAEGGFPGTFLFLPCLGFGCLVLDWKM